MTEFFSTRGGGIRSYLTRKDHILCQLGHTHRVIAPGPRSEELELDSHVFAPRSAAAGQVAGHASDAGATDAPPHDTSRHGVLQCIAGPPLPYDPSYHLLWRVSAVADAIRAVAPDVLEVHSTYVAAAAALRVARRHLGLRTLFWHSDHIDTFVTPLLSRHLGEHAGRRGSAPLWAGMRALTSRFDAVFVASETQRRKLDAQGIPRLHKIPFGVDTATFSPAARSTARRRSWLGDQPEPPDARVVVAVGRMAAEKHWDVVLDAFLRAAADQPHWHLVALGEGPERAALEARVQQASRQGARNLAKRVHFLGFVPSREATAEILASADVFLHGCPYETFGLSVAEALACGLTAVVPEAGGAGEWVDGQRCRGYPALDAPAAAAALGTLLGLDAAQRLALPALHVTSEREHFEHLLAHYAALREQRGR